MSQEISVTISGTCKKGQLSESFGGTVVREDMSGVLPKVFSQVKACSTSEETVETGDIQVLGKVWMKNLEDPGGNSVTYGPDSTGMVALGILNPNEECVFRLVPAATLKIQANIGAVGVHIKIYED